jgi:hypothetical protein
MLAEFPDITSGNIVPLAAIGFGCLIPMVAMVTHHWRKLRQTEMEIALKHDMVNRGMSADEIERVIKASGPVDDSCAHAGHATRRSQSV